MWIVVFWVVTPRGLVGGSQRFGGAYRFHPQIREDDDRVSAKSPHHEDTGREVTR
jgi:hypothetical protein